MKSLAALALLFAGLLLFSCKALIHKAEASRSAAALCLRSGVCR